MPKGLRRYYGNGHLHFVTAQLLPSPALARPPAATGFEEVGLVKAIAYLG